MNQSQPLEQHTSAPNRLACLAQNETAALLALLHLATAMFVNLNFKPIKQSLFMWVDGHYAAGTVTIEQISLNRREGTRTMYGHWKPESREVFEKSYPLANRIYPIQIRFTGPYAPDIFLFWHADEVEHNWLVSGYIASIES